MSSIFGSFAAVAGNEELGLGEDGQQIDVELPQTAEAIAEVVADRVIAENQEQIQEIAEQVVEVADAVEQTQEVVEDIQDTVEGLESLLQGNFNPVAASKNYQRLQGLVSKLGGSISSERIGAESLTDASTAQMLMRDGMEAATKEGEGWFSKAATFLKGLWQRIVAFVVGLFNSAAGFRRKVDILRKKMETATVKTKVKAGDWNRFFDVKNGKGGIGQSVGLFGSAVDELGSMIDDAPALADDVNAFVKRYQAVVLTLKKADFASGGNSAAKGDVERAVANQFGTRSVIQFSTVSSIKEIKDISRACRTVRLSMVANPDSKVETSGEIETKYGAAELRENLDRVIAICKSLEQAKSKKALTSAGADRVIAGLRAELTKDDDKAKAKIVFNNITAMAAMVNRIIADTATMQTKRAKATLSMVSAHLGGEEKK